MIDDQAIGAMSPRSVARAVAVVAQDGPADGFDISVGEFVLLGRHVHRRDYQGFANDDGATALRALESVSLGGFIDRGLQELSGGERQRVLIARCLAQESPVILLDEPTNHLDIRYQHEILALVGQLEVETIVVLHDFNLASRYCDHLVLLDSGHVVAQGTPDQVLQSRVLEPVYVIEVRRLVDGADAYLAFGLTQPGVVSQHREIEGGTP